MNIDVKLIKCNIALPWNSHENRMLPDAQKFSQAPCFFSNWTLIIFQFSPYVCNAFGSWFRLCIWKLSHHTHANDSIIVFLLRSALWVCIIYYMAMAIPNQFISLHKSRGISRSKKWRISLSFCRISNDFELKWSVSSICIADLKKSRKFLQLKRDRRFQKCDMPLVINEQKKSI